MKKRFLFLLLCLFLFPLSVSADHMYHVDMDIHLEKDGSAIITEVWDVKADSGTEWYKALYNLGDSEISNYGVYIDNELMTFRTNWDVNASLQEKRGYYGINYTSDGIELCFGKNDMKRHKFTIKYKLSNYIFNTSDSQVLYWTLMPNVTVDSFNVDIDSYYDFPDTLDVWGYGYKGYAYVSDGKISMSSEGKLKNDYVVLLAKFPLNTFNIVNTNDRYDSFSDVYDQAEEGTFEYDYDTDGDGFFEFIFGFLPLLLTFGGITTAVNVAIQKTKHGYINNKQIDKKNVPMFRDIPCNKDIYYANALINLNDFDYVPSNIFGAIILKWVREDKIIFRNSTEGIFNKNTSSIDLTRDVVFDNDNETKLFNMMRAASGDGILETKELEKWCRKNYSKFFDIFTNIKDDKIRDLKSKGYIFNRVNKEQCKYNNVMNDEIYNDSIKLYGLKKYLKEFSNMNTKEVMEVKLWDQYLMFAYLFGIADKVAKQLKNLYPEVIEEMSYNNCDYDTLIFINHISTRSVSAASSARSAAESYSSGGGGFSSGGGGGGSFGGGGSMGGR